MTPPDVLLIVSLSALGAALYLCVQTVLDALAAARLRRKVAAAVKAATPKALEIEPLRDGGEIGYWHPQGWPVRIVQGLPVAVGPFGDCERWSATANEWTWLPPESGLATEARERLRLEETQRLPRLAPRRVFA